MYRLGVERLYNTTTDLASVNRWASWASTVEQAEPGPPVEGKQYRLGYRVPGTAWQVYTTTLTVLHCSPREKLVLQGENLLQPRY